MTTSQRAAILADLHDLRLAVDCAEDRLQAGKDLRDHELRQQFRAIRRLSERMPGPADHLDPTYY
jgi:hypothetical protein